MGSNQEIQQRWVKDRNGCKGRDADRYMLVFVRLVRATVCCVDVIRGTGVCCVDVVFREASPLR